MQTTLHARIFDNTLTFSGDGFIPAFASNADFWRLHLDHCCTGLSRDLGVYSHEQTPTAVTEEGDLLTVSYDSLLAENGVRYPIALTLTVRTAADGALAFSAQVKNGSAARINELQYPLLELTRIAGDFEEDVLYAPRGLGARIPFPYRAARHAHTEYMAADYKNIWSLSTYPGQMSMPWFGIHSGGHFLSLSRREETCRITGFATGTEPRGACERRLIMTVCSYAAIRPGEEAVLSGYRVAAYVGDWRTEADSYRAYANATYLSDLVGVDGRIPHKESIRRLDGWQRIILKHQYGEIYHTYADLPRIWREGVKYGIRMILLFAWWQEGMDNGYPNYQPDEALGGADALRAAVDEIHAAGGRVILYANGHIMDAATDYYRTEGHRYTMKNIEGMEYREFYKFANNGTMLRFGGHKTFVPGCHGTPQWRAKVEELGERERALGSSGVFFDQLNCCFNLCFDDTHEHGARIDEEPRFRIDTIERIRAGLCEDEWFGTEWPMDRISPRIDFTHGCGPSTAFREDAYPYIFRYTFPEALISNRMAHDEKAGYRRELNYAFVHGLLFDVALWRCRIDSIDDCPNYAAYLKQLTDLRSAYRDFFTEGAYDMLPDGLPDTVRGAQYTRGDRRILALWNDGADAVTVLGTSIAPGKAAVIETAR